jgi:hypothetical protein
MPLAIGSQRSATQTCQPIRSKMELAMELATELAQDFAAKKLLRQ